MKHLSISIFAAFAIFALGFGAANMANLQPARASSQMASMSTADMQMQAAMNRMNGRTQAMHMTGDTDRDFMMMMIAHHQSAIDMAKVELQYGHHNQLKTLARNVISSQARELSQMRAWLRSWYRK
ncbi:MAG: DUF305 domain-containing protein [Candidatus Eremiobacteraeota bacterium]|nr:DUF305 domain-containing protein [Candidatus Eremiobacteraeota bacterium]